MKQINIKNEPYYFITEENLKMGALMLFADQRSYDDIKDMIDDLTPDDISIIESCIEETFKDGKYDTDLGIERGLNEVWDLGYDEGDDDEV